MTVKQNKVKLNCRGKTEHIFLLDTGFIFDKVALTASLLKDMLIRHCC